MDYTAITGAVDFATALTALGAVAAALGGLYIAGKGAKAVLNFMK